MLHWLARRIERLTGARNHIWVWRPRRCWNCDRWTWWTEINFEAALHRGACTKTKDDAYWDALREGDLVELLDKLATTVRSEWPTPTPPARELLDEADYAVRKIRGLERVEDLAPGDRHARRASGVETGEHDLVSGRREHGLREAGA